MRSSKLSPYLITTTIQFIAPVSNRPSFTPESLSQPHKLKPPNFGGHRAFVPPFLPPRPPASLPDDWCHCPINSPRHFFPAPFLGPFSHPSTALPQEPVPSLDLPRGQVHRYHLSGNPRATGGNPTSPGGRSLCHFPLHSLFSLSTAMTTDLPSPCQLSSTFPPDAETSSSSTSHPPSLGVLSLAHFPPQSLFVTTTMSCPSCPCPSWSSRTSPGPRPLPSSVVALVACPCHLHCWHSLHAHVLDPVGL